MGAIFGLFFACSGAEVIFFDNRPDVVEAIIRNGLVLEGLSGTSTKQFRATNVAGELGKVDLALILVNHVRLPRWLMWRRTILGESGIALTLQNGIGNWEALATRLGRERVLAGSTYNSGAGVGPGHARHTNLGPTVIGEIDGSISMRAREIGELLGTAGLPIEITNNIQGHIWSKFVHNCAINPVSALTGLRPGEIARTRKRPVSWTEFLTRCLPSLKPLGLISPRTIHADRSGITAGSVTIALLCFNTLRAGGEPRSMH